MCAANNYSCINKCQYPVQLFFRMTQYARIKCKLNKRLGDFLNEHYRSEVHVPLHLEGGLCHSQSNQHKKVCCSFSIKLETSRTQLNMAAYALSPTCC